MVVVGKTKESSRSQVGAIDEPWLGSPIAVKIPLAYHVVEATARPNHDSAPKEKTLDWQNVFVVSV